MKKRRNKLYFIIGMIVFLFTFISTFLMMSGTEINISIILLLSLFIAFLIVLIFIFWIKMFIFAIINPLKRVNQVRRIQNAQHIDSKEYEYIREIPKNYSPALASLILDQSLEYNKDIIATTLFLINHGYLKEEDNQIVRTNKDSYGLMEHEQYLISVFEKNQAFINSRWKGKLFLDAYNQGLIMQKSSLDKKDYITITLNVLAPITILIILISVLDLLSKIEHIMAFIGFFLIIMLLPFAGIFTLIYIFLYLGAFFSKDIKLTNKGLKDQEKLAKLKKYLKDFTNIEVRKKEEYVLWEDYLTFAVAFNLNEQILVDDNFKEKVNHLSNIIKHDILDELSNLEI